MSDESKKPLGRILLQQRALSPEALDAGLEQAKAKGESLASALVETGTLSEVQALKALSEQMGVPGIDIGQICVRLSDLQILPREVAVRHEILPVLVRDDRMFVAMAEPTEKQIIDELEFVTGKRVFPYVALAVPLRAAIQAAYDLLERGETFYVGPRCPPEVKRKAGIEVEEEPFTPAAPAAPPPAPAPPPAAAAPPPRPAPPPAPPPVPPPPRPEPRAAPPPPRPEAPKPAAPAPANAPATAVVDGMFGRAGVVEDDETSFGDVDREVSKVTALPVPGLADGVLAPAGAKTVLVVDDEADIRKLLRRVLEERGYRVLEADRGLVALRIVKEHLPDVIVLDAMLPEMHGFELARRLKGSQRYGHIPVIMVSAVYKGWRIADDVKTSYGVEAYIEKPFRISDVLAAVEAGVKKNAGERANVEAISAEAERLLEAGISAYREGRTEEAIEALRRGTQIDPLAYRLHLHLGLLFGKQGQVYEAIQELETALSINSRHFPALKNLAVLYQKAGFRNKAIETWERAVRFAPDEETRASIKQHLLTLL